MILSELNSFRIAGAVEAGYYLDDMFVEVSWKNLDDGMTALQLRKNCEVDLDLSDYVVSEKVSDNLYFIRR